MMEPIFSDSIERAVLSTLWYYSDISHNEAITKIIPQLTDKLFYEPSNIEIFKAIKALYPKDITLVNISVRIQKKIPAYQLTEILSADSVSLAQLTNYISYLKTLTFRRYAYNFAEGAKQAAAQDDVQGVMSYINGIQRVHKALSTTDREDFFRKAIEEQGDNFIPSSFPKLNQLIGGYSRREISSLGGKSGHQKTAWCIDDATESIKRGLAPRIHYISVEHPGDIIAIRILSKEMGVPYQDILQKTAVFDKPDAYEFLKKTYGGKFIITDSATSMKQVIDSIKSTQVDRHIIDHAQEIIYPNNNMTDGISEILLDLKACAREQKSNIMLISQVVDKQVNERVDSRIPRSTDLYNSSRIKQESRQMLMVYWKYQDAIEFEAENPMDEFNKFLIVVHKSTYGKVGRLSMEVKPETGNFK